MAQKTIIYKISNLVNGKEYIGRTRCDIRKRFNEHIADSKYTQTTNILHQDIRKYGRENFIIFKVGEFYCENDYVADTIELQYIDEYDTWYPNGYNKRRVHR